jgi:hypothetical protein
VFSDTYRGERAVLAALLAGTEKVNVAIGALLPFAGVVGTVLAPPQASSNVSMMPAAKNRNKRIDEHLWHWVDDFDRTVSRAAQQYLPVRACATDRAAAVRLGAFEPRTGNAELSRPLNRNRRSSRADGAPSAQERCIY